MKQPSTSLIHNRNITIFSPICCFKPCFVVVVVYLSYPEHKKVDESKSRPGLLITSLSLFNSNLLLHQSSEISTMFAHIQIGADHTNFRIYGQQTSFIFFFILFYWRDWQNNNTKQLSIYSPCRHLLYISVFFLTTIPLATPAPFFGIYWGWHNSALHALSGAITLSN